MPEKFLSNLTDGSYRIAAELHQGDDEHSLEVRSPVDGSLVGKMHEFSHDEIDKVFYLTSLGQVDWANSPIDERARILHRVADNLEKYADALTEVLVMEVAKATKDARDEVLRSADFVRHTAEEAKHLVGEAQFSDAFARHNRNKMAISYRVPLGMVLAIPPFNYPINLGLSKIAPALVGGNAVVLKPPSQGSVACAMLAELLWHSGVPHDVFALVTGRGSRIGDYLVQHPAVSMISFTGSTEVGRDLANKAGMVPLLLELGGKDAAIVLSDADLQAAADHIVAGAFAYAGQRCTAVKRVLCSEEVADELVELLGRRIATLAVGDPRDNATVTPLVDPAAAERALSLVDDAVSKGAELLGGGGRRGNLVEPTLLDHVTEEMDVAWVEPFAPVLPVLRVVNAAEAVRISNASEYGLQAALFTRDVDVATQICMRLDVGTVQVNGKTARGPDHFPFLGTKSSGMGVQGVRYSIEAMTRIKAMVINMSDRDLSEIH